jgi:hypothetical protein
LRSFAGGALGAIGEQVSLFGQYFVAFAVDYQRDVERRYRRVVERTHREGNAENDDPVHQNGQEQSRPQTVVHGSARRNGLQVNSTPRELPKL